MPSQARRWGTRRSLRWLSIGIIVVTIALYASTGGYSTGYNAGTWDIQFVIGQVSVLRNLPAQPAKGLYRQPYQSGFFPILFSPTPLPPPRNVIVPMWVPAAMAGVLPLFSRSKAGRTHGRCPDCDYDQTGNNTGRCPECGTAFGHHPRKTTGTPANGR